MFKKLICFLKRKHTWRYYKYDHLLYNYAWCTWEYRICSQCKREEGRLLFYDDMDFLGQTGWIKII